jgi:DNA-binding NarL/FixJ family response regulator
MTKVAVVSGKINKKKFKSLKNAVLFSFNDLSEALKWAPDIIITDDECFPENVPANIKILVTSESTREKILRYIHYPCFCGFVKPDTSPHLMEKAIKTIQKGEIWVNRESISLIFDEFAKHVRRKNYHSDLLNVLSRREREVLNLMLKGFSNKAIAENLFISEKTVKTHIYNFYKKLGISRRTEAVSLLLNED